MTRNLPPFAIALKQRQENQNIAPKAPQQRPYYSEYEEEFSYLDDSREFDESTYNETEPEIPTKMRSTKKSRKSKNSQKQLKSQSNSNPQNNQINPQYQPQQMNEQDHDYLAEIEDYRNLLVDLQKKNSDLEAQISDLTAENATLQTFQQDLIKERQISDDYFKQIDELKDALRDEQIKSKCFKEQVTQLESIVQSKNQQIEAKESMIHSINVAYNQMVSEYQANGLLVGTLTGQIRQYTKQISELEAQIAELKSAQRNINLSKRYETCIDPKSYQPNYDSNIPDDSKFNNFYPPPESNLNAFSDNNPQSAFNDFNQNPMPNGFNDFGSQQNGFNDFGSQQTGFNDFGGNGNAFSEFGQKSNCLNDFISQSNQQNDLNPPPGAAFNDFPETGNQPFDDSPYFQPTNEVFGSAQMPLQASTATVKRSALVDNIQFDTQDVAPPPEDELDLQSMSTTEMKDKLLVLQKERDEIERILNKAPPKGKLLAHVNREKEEKERQLDALVKQISKIKYRLKVIKAL